ncbi:MAG TPA: DEAD/DEAH box helicase [Solirubrobacterales bacterium]|jgi:superfamily II DNA/RNA helicase|nr:DEAD/DEAH box helicase [Solirubrobacterales bacterium]
MSSSYRSGKSGNGARRASSPGAHKRAGGGNGGGRPSGRGSGGGGGRGKKRPQLINPEKFVNKAITPVERPAYVATNAFTDFELDERLKRNVAKHGYETPTQIQDVAIEPVLAGRDLVGLANTGTGKTAAFILPIIQGLLDRDRGTALVMAPTRELAVQIDEEFKAFARGLKLYSSICVGGVSINKQISALRRNPDIVIGTPGRLKDLLNRGELHLQDTDVLVLDEADRMLDMGFIKDIRYIVEKIPTDRQSLCFSATITREIESLLKDFLKDPVTCSVKTNETNDHIEQSVIEASSKEHKIELLQEMLTEPEFEKVIIFGQTKHGVQKLADKLSKSGLRAEAIHGNKSQSQRQRSLNAFKNNAAQILVATDVASRGLDIPEVSHVINFDQPDSYEDYIHRIGRTGRAGLGGQALTFVAAKR